MAWTAASAAKGAAAMHRKHGAGHLTAAMLAADRANLAKGRAKRKYLHKGSSHHLSRKGFKLPHKPQKPVLRGNSTARRINQNNYFTLRSKLPLGERRISYHKRLKPFVRKSTGLNKKFIRTISPGGYDRRTKWAHATKHNVKKVLKPRKHRTAYVHHWSTGRRKTPR